MINSMIEAISISLNREFGAGYTTYTEAVKQGLKEPCFFISQVRRINRFFRGDRYSQGSRFCIQYFPGNQLQPRKECQATASRLERCLEYITVKGDLVRGTNMSYEIEDGILHFFVDYDCFVRRETVPLPGMEGLAGSISAKG